MHKRGLHCGSTAMGDALRARGLDLPETTVFGLGAGCDLSFWDGDTRLAPPQPSRFFVGRSGSFEHDLCAAVGAELVVERFATPVQAMQRLRALCAEGELPLVYTDLFALPYLGAHGHWFGHLVAVADEHRVFDNERDEPQAIDDLGRALCGPAPVPGAPVLLRVVSAPRAPRYDARRQVALNAARPMPWDALAGELRSWQSRADWGRCVRLAGQSLELRGNGGGFFRRMYAEFLDAHGFAELSRLALAAAEAHRTLALELQRVHAAGVPSLDVAATLADDCARAEAALWSRAREVAS